jgi:hypothetical protein
MPAPHPPHDGPRFQRRGPAWSVCDVKHLHIAVDVEVWLPSVAASPGHPEMKAHDTAAFEQMIAAMRQRLRPTEARLFADQLRICVGLNCTVTDENRLLKMLLQEVSLSLGAQLVRTPTQFHRSAPHLATRGLPPVFS